jgi:hypothetical protein
MKALRAQNFHIEADLPGIMDSRCEITEDVWPEVVSSLTTIYVISTEDEGNFYYIDNSSQLSHGTTWYTGIISLPRGARDRGLFFICLPTGKRIKLAYLASMRVEELKNHIWDACGTPASTQRLIYSGKQLSDELTLEESGVTTASEIHLVQSLRGGKPVIYILSPDPLKDVAVSLRLVPSWSFSAIYPTATVARNNKGEQIKWIVDTAEDGTLLDKSSGLRVSYLFWEAESVVFLRQK